MGAVVGFCSAGTDTAASSAHSSSTVAGSPPGSFYPEDFCLGPDGRVGHQSSCFPEAFVERLHSEAEPIERASEMTAPCVSVISHLAPLSAGRHESPGLGQGNQSPQRVPVLPEGLQL